MNDAELAHDLRMPLQLMMSCAQLLELELGENRRARGYVEMLLSSAAEMQQMLLGALERPAVPVPGDLVGRTWEICARCRLYARRKGVGLTFHSSIDRLETYLDAEKYSRVLMNLLSNALKFTPEGGEVRVTVRALSDFAEVDVADDGCGIAPERLPTVFDLHATDGGYGYGLYTARLCARQMGGALTAASRPGEGSVFTLRLPVRGRDEVKHP